MAALRSDHEACAECACAYYLNKWQLASYEIFPLYVQYIVLHQHAERRWVLYKASFSFILHNGLHYPREQVEFKAAELLKE